MGLYNSLIQPDVRMMLDEGDELGLAEFCDALYPGVTAEIIEDMPAADVWQILDACSLERRVEIFEFFSVQRQTELVENLDRDRLSRLLEEMSPDDRVDLLNRLDEERVEQLLPLIAQAERSDIRKLLSCEDDTAGAIMTTEYASLPADLTVSEALEQLRRQAPDRETIYYIYILDAERHLLGFISLRELILAPAQKPLSDIMRRGVISVPIDQDQEFVAQELAKYDFIAMPVVDRENRLVGIVTHDDVLDVVQEEATEDAQRLAAVQPLDDSYLETPILVIAWKRGGWLLFLAFVALVTAQVLKHYESTSDSLEWIVLFLPLVLASGGNAGSQSATLIIRSLAVDETTRDENLHMARREGLLGGLLGFSLSAVTFAAAFFWFHLGISESLVVSLTVFLVVIMGMMSGVILPLTFKRLGMDPAIMSTPLIAAIVDVVGVLVYYNVAIFAMSAAVD